MVFNTDTCYPYVLMFPARRRPAGEQTYNRRTVLAAGATVATAGLAGCSSIANYLGDRFLEDVVAINGMNRRIAGAITVVEPGGDTVLDTRFDLPASEDDGGSSNETESTESDEDSGIWSDVYTENGDYEVTVELDEPIDGMQTATETAAVTDIEEEHIMVLLGNEDIPSPIHVTVIENFSDLGQEFEQE